MKVLQERIFKLVWFKLQKYRVNKKEKEVILVDCDKDDCEQVNEEKRELFTHQKLCRDYLNPNSLQRNHNFTV